MSIQLPNRNRATQSSVLSTQHSLLRVGPLLVALVVLLAAATLPMTARADGALEVLQVGWDGTAVPDTWSPVRVRVTGDGVDASARVEVVLKAWYQRGPQVARVEVPVGAYGQELPLPAGVTKEATIWVPVQGNTVGVVQLSVAGQLLAEERVEFQGVRAPTWPLIGVLAEAPAVARSLGQIELPFQGLPVPLSVARLSAADLPATAERLGALSALVVQGSAATALTGEQRRALQDWVMAGGHLVGAGGPDAPRTAAALPSGALPVTFSGADGSAELSELARWARTREAPPAVGPAARFQTSGGTLLAGTRERPLAWRLSLGKGTVTLLAADPALQPLASWSDTPALLQKALEPALPSAADNEKMRYLAMEQRNGAMRLQSVVEMLPGEAFPGWRTIALILGVFALVVGPLIHLILWRIDRREWVWLVVPGAALLATGVLYVAGIGYGGRDVLANVIAHVRLDPESGRASQSLAAGFYAPTRPSLSITIPGDVPVRATSQGTRLMYDPSGMPLAQDPGRREGDLPFRVLSGRDTRVEFASDEWTMRVVTFERPLDDQVGRITGHLGLADGLIKGTLRNDTPYTIEDAAIVVGQSAARLGRLASGQTAAVVLDPGPVMNPSMGGPPLSYRLFARTREELAASGQSGGAGMGAYQYQVSPAMPVPAYPAPPPLSRPLPAAPAAPAQTPGPTPTPAAAAPRPAATLAAGSSPPPAISVRPPPGSEYVELPRDPEVRRRVRLFDAIMGAPRQNPGGQMLPLTFLGFVPAPVGQSVPTAGSHRTYHLTLLEQPLQIELAPGPFWIPASLIPAETLAQSSRGMGGGGSPFIGGGNPFTVAWTEIYDGWIAYSYRPPLPRGAKAEALVVTTRQIGPATPTMAGRGSAAGPNVTPGPAEAGVFTVYNWQAAAWDTLPEGEEAVRLQAGPYLGTDGLVKIQITTPAAHAVRFLIPELTVEGTAGP